MSSEEGVRLMRLRRRAGLSQIELAEALGVNNQTVSNWEKGHRALKLSPVMMLNLCKALQCSLEELAGEFSESAK